MAQNHIEQSEAPMTRGGTIQGPSRRYRRLRHPTFPADEWTANNPLLQRGEIGYEVDTGKVKIGDGYTLWNDLQYISGSDGTAWGAITGTLSDQIDLQDALDAKVSKAGDTMSGPLTFTNTEGAGGIFGFTNGVVFFYMNGDTRTQLAALNTQGFAPYADDTMILGGTNLKWHEAHMSTAYVSVINNGANIGIPTTGGTMVVATPPTVAGTYVLKAVVDGDGNVTYSWVSE